MSAEFAWWASLRLLLAVLFLSLAAPAAANERDWAHASDAGVGILALWSLGVPLAKRDDKGALQAAGSMAAAEAVAQGLKYTFPETRPDGSDRRSFPSGHTSLSFAAAASIFERRGPQEGIPAFALASFVGLSRVEAKKHHWYDVVAGAAIGTAGGLLVTHPLKDKQVAVIPWGDTYGGGAVLAMRF